MKNINCICCDSIVNIGYLYKKDNKYLSDYTNQTFCNKCNCKYIHGFSDYFKSFCHFTIIKDKFLKEKDTLQIRFEYLTGMLDVDYYYDPDFSNDIFSDRIGYVKEEIPKDPFIELSIQYKYYLKYIDNIIFA
jgi:hypothetical protein